MRHTAVIDVDIPMLSVILLPRAGLDIVDCKLSLDVNLFLARSYFENRVSRSFWRAGPATDTLGIQPLWDTFSPCDD